MVIVADGSALVGYLVAEGEGEWVEQHLLADPDLHAPHLVDLEIANALRNLTYRGELETVRAEAALGELALLDLRRHTHTPLLERIWELRENLSASDAAYVALAEALEAPLLTLDARLTRVPGLPVEVIAP